MPVPPRSGALDPAGRADRRASWPPGSAGSCTTRRFLADWKTWPTGRK